MGAVGYAAGDGDGKGTVKDDCQVSGFSIWVDVLMREMGRLEEVTSFACWRSGTAPWLFSVLLFTACNCLLQSSPPFVFCG